MGAVFFALLFTFLIGVTGNGVFSEATSTQASTATVTSASMIYRYFGSAYTDLIDAIGNTNYDASALFTMFFPTVVGTLIVVATLVTVLTLSILAIVRYVKFVSGKSEKDYAKLSIAAVLAYLTGTVAFFALHAASAVVSSNGVGTTTATKFTAETVAGIVLSCVFLGSFIGCRIAIHAKEVFLQKRLATLILSAAGVVLFSIALHFAGVGIAKMSYRPAAISSLATVKIGGGYAVLAAIALLNVRTSSGVYYLPDDFVVPSVLAFVGLIVQIVFLVMLACAIVKFLSNLASDEEKGNLKFSITATVFAAVHLTLCILACVFMIEAHANLDAAVSYAYPIVALVFTLLSLGMTIAHKVFLKKCR